MRKTLFIPGLLFALVMLGGLHRAAAQITAITNFGGLNSSTPICMLPDTAYFGIGGNLTGTMPPGDSVTFYVNYGDGSDTAFKMLDSTSIYTTLNHVYTMSGNYNWYFSITATSSISASTTASSPFSVSNTCANIQGTTYLDLNSDCTRDAGDANMPYVPVVVVTTATHDTTWGIFTDDTGGYAANLLPDNYVLYAVDQSGGAVSVSCPTSGSYSVTATAGGTFNENYGFTCNTLTSFDMSVNGYTDNVVLGDSTFCMAIGTGGWLWGSGITCNPLSSTVTLTLNPHLHYLSNSHMSLTPTSIVGNVITWNLATVTDHFNFGGTVKLYCDAGATMGSILTSTLTATATSLPDPTMANNTMVFSALVVASWDPNGIAVSPKGTGTPGYIANGTPLTYNVHFQNTGTAPARNVTVNDTLDNNVDMHTLTIISSSSPVEVNVTGHVIKFRFDGINLPDSLSSPNSSIGNVVYTIQPKTPLAEGTQIKNKAGIYFDYNPAVLTNTALNTIAIPTSVTTLSSATFTAKVYPNPANNEVIAQADDLSDFTITVTDMLGRVVATGSGNNGTAAVSIQSIAAGLYLVKLVNANGKELTTKLSIQH